MRIGLVGCGNWGRHILRDLIDIGCEVSVVARSEGSIARARKGGARSIVAHIGALERSLDGYVVAVPSTVHAEVVEALIERRRPIFVEKPLSVDRASARRIAAAAPEHVFVMDKWRYHPGIQEIARIARMGEMGTLRSLHTRRLGWGHPHRDTDPVWMLAPHELSIILEIVGDLPTPLWASAEPAAQGACAGLIATLGPQPMVTLQISVSCTVRERSCRAVFDAGTVMLADAYADHILVQRGCALAFRDHVPPEKRTVSSEMPLLRELRAFIDHIGGGPPPRSSAREGAGVVALIEDLRKLAGLGTG